MSGEKEIDFLPNRLNRQPVIFRGMTNTELFTLAGFGGVIGLVVGILVAIVFGDWIWIPTIMLLMPLATVMLGGKTITRLKRGKPETWLLRYLDWTKARWIATPYYINPNVDTAYFWSSRRNRSFRRKAK